MTVEEAINGHDREVEQATTSLKSRLHAILQHAEIAILAALSVQLVTRNGIIVSSAANVQVLMSLAGMLRAKLLAAGLDEILKDFLSSFDRQEGFFQQLLKAQGVQEPPAFTDREQSFFDERKAAVALLLLNIAEQVGEIAQFQAVIYAGAATLADLSAAVMKTLSHLVPRIDAAAELQLVTFYRTVASEGYKILQARTPGKLQEFVYDGPGAGDPVIRKFCKHLMLAGGSWTRAEIDEMNNGQLPNVFLAGGGFGCRHIWILHTDDKNRLSGEEIRQFDSH